MTPERGGARPPARANAQLTWLPGILEGPVKINDLIQRIRRTVEKIRDDEAVTPGFWIRWARHQAYLYWFVVRSLYQERCLQQAAALTYTTLLSLIPLLAVAFSVFKAFHAFEGLDRRVEQAVFQVILASPFMEDQAGTGPEALLEDIDQVLRKKPADPPEPKLAAEAFRAAESTPRTQSFEALKLYLSALNEGQPAAEVRQGLSTLMFGRIPPFVLRAIRPGFRPALIVAYQTAADLDPEAATPGGPEADPEALAAVTTVENLRLAARYDEALQAAQRAREKGAPPWALLPEEARALAGKGEAVKDYREAIALYRHALLETTDSIVLYARHYNEMAFESLLLDHDTYVQKLALLHKNLAARIREQAAALDAEPAEKDRLLHEAVTELRQAVLVLNNSSDVHLALANSLWQVGLRDEAQKHYVAATRTANQRVAKGFSSAITEYLRSFIARVNTASIGLIGVVFLIFTAVGLLNTIEKTFNNIWRVTSKRPYWIKFTSFCTFLWLGPLMIGLSIYIREKISSRMAAALSSAETFGGTVRFLGGVLNYVAPFVFILVILVALYKFLPHTTVQWRYAFYGAFVTGILLQLARPLFAMYLKRAVRYQEIYGSLGAIPVFLLWVWLLWIIVILGAQISYVSQNVWTIYRHERTAKLSQLLIDRYLAVRVMYYVGLAFFRGRGATTVPELADRLRITEEEIANVCERLGERGLVMPANDDHTNFVPARDMEDIPMIEIAEINTSLRNNYRSTREEDRDAEEHLDELFDRMELSDRNVLRNLSLYDLIRRFETEKDSPAEPAPA
jgi:membrane protein